MDSEAALKLPVPSEKRPSSSPIPPQQLSDKPAELADLIRTPKRLEEHPPRASNRGFALSVTEVSQVALGLQSPTGRSDVDPLLAEEQLGPVSGPCSTPNSSEAKTLLKLPEKYVLVIGVPQKKDSLLGSILSTFASTVIRYELLCEFLDSMEISVRLLRQKGLMSTFSNICTSIQSSMDRRFTYVHLAQLKCVLPEAIMIKKVLLHDVATCSLKTELQVTLQVDAVARNMKEKSESGRSILPAVFRERLVEFFKNHPEGDEVPVERLPHPFNLTEIGGYPTVNVETDPSFNESSSNAAVQQQFLVPSHMSQSFNILNPHKTPLMSLPSSPVSSVCGGGEKDAAGLPTADDCSHEESKVRLETPTKLMCTPLTLMTDTPEIPASKRCRTTPACDSTPSSKSVRRSTRTKLFMTPEENAEAGEKESGDRSLCSSYDILSFLPETLLHSIKEKEQKIMQEREPGFVIAIRRKKLIASLPTIFDMILLIFQSWKRSVMTKQDLIHQLVSSHYKIVDQDEVEDQLKLLLELVPDWISKKIACDGDILCWKRPRSSLTPDQLWTPEKPAQHPRSARNRSVAFSLTEVRRVALGLQRPAGRSHLDPLPVDDSGPCSTPKPSRAKTLPELPEKYELLCEFFNCMESSLRLLRLKGSMSTFPNISTSIQSLMDRRFTYVRLAQLKHIMPEVIMIKKVLLHDETTCCIKPELQVTLQVDAVAKNIKGKSESGYSILRAVFRERLVEFSKTHPQGDEVPEEQLPHPFNPTKLSVHKSANINDNPSSAKSSSSAALQQQFLVPSHMPQSFKRHFSRKIPVLNPEKTPPMCSSGACPKDDHSTFVDSSAISKKPLLSSPISTTLPIVEGGDERDAAGSPSADDYPDEESNIQKGTPAKLVCTPLRLMADTPEIPTSKRLRTTPSNKSVRRSTRTKLFMTPEKSANDVLDFLPKTLLQSVSFITSSCCGVLALRLLKMFLEMPFCTTISWLMR
ncbi:DNA replication initiation protein [Musa troglodytarum]|uniref:DNA replication initiation protein n=1 Tax=Musa troglodytarum TaxID=320322 RepID=A0A9E7HGJ5_9LILI|nr:DNA replication initiation protein [Musa troglodytarum]